MCTLSPDSLHVIFNYLKIIQFTRTVLHSYSTHELERVFPAILLAMCYVGCMCLQCGGQLHLFRETFTFDLMGTTVG